MLFLFVLKIFNFEVDMECCFNILVYIDKKILV